MNFDDEFLDRVRNTASIVDVVSDYVHLKKTGQNHVALCPFHSEKTPSFSVSESKQIFKCFGCGVGGDVFGFVMEMEKLTFPEAIRYLAERHGIPLPASDPRQVARESKKERLKEAIEAAQDFFTDCLASEQGEKARNYLRERDIDSETSDRFGLGYAPTGNRLLDRLQKAGFSPDELDACGLIKREGTRCYDKFRDRVMFPICNVSGRPIAFGGRILGDSVPKYLNSPETPIYHKGSHLYAIHVSRDEIRKRGFAILVEGYFDCIVPYQFGFRNVIASLGTSLTEGQVQLLGRYTRKILVNFDPDTAGQAAALRSIELLLKQGFQINVVQLSGGLDPDSFLREYGADAYREAMEASLPYVDFVFQKALQEQREPESPRAKREIAAAVLPFLARMPNRIERAEYVSRLADRLRVSEGLLLSELRRVARGRSPDEKDSRLAGLIAFKPAERVVLEAILEEWEDGTWLEEVEADLFAGLISASLIEKILAEKKQNPGISVLKLRDQLEPADADLLERVIVQMKPGPKPPEIVQQNLNALRDRRDNRAINALNEKIVRAEKDGNLDQVSELLSRKERLRRERLERERH